MFTLLSFPLLCFPPVIDDSYHDFQIGSRCRRNFLLFLALSFEPTQPGYIIPLVSQAQTYKEPKRRKETSDLGSQLTPLLSLLPRPSDHFSSDSFTSVVAPLIFYPLFRVSKADCLKKEMCLDEKSLFGPPAWTFGGACSHLFRVPFDILLKSMYLQLQRHHSRSFGVITYKNQLTSASPSPVYVLQ